MKVEVGDTIVRWGGFQNIFVLQVSGRTENTLETRLPGEGPIGFMDKRASLSHFRVYDKRKVDRLLELEQEIKEKHDEMRELFNSLPQVE